jgi:hypothetical protein
MNKLGAPQFAFPSVAPGYPQQQAAMPGQSQPQLHPQPQPSQPGLQQQQHQPPGQLPMHNGAPINPFPNGPTHTTVSNTKVPTLPPKTPGSAKLAHRTVSGPGVASGFAVGGVMKKEGASPNLEAKDTKDGIKKSPASRPASQPSKPVPGAATPSTNTGLQPGGPVGGGGAPSPTQLMAHQQRQGQVQATVNQSPSFLSAGVGAAGGMLSTAGAGIPLSNPGATANLSASLPSSGLEYNFNQMSGAGDYLTDSLSFGFEYGLGGTLDDSLMASFLNMSDPMDGNNLLGQ